MCNLREFKVFVRGDQSNSRWTKVLHSGLRNDSESEAFPLTYPHWSDDNTAVPQPIGPFSLISVEYRFGLSSALCQDLSVGGVGK